MRPLVLDIVHTLLPMAGGLLAFAAGRQSARLRRPTYFTVIGIAVIVVVIAWPVHLLFPVRLGAWLFRAGGEAAPAMWAGLFLLGVACMLPNRTLRTRFVVAVVSLVSVILLLQGGGRLIWRFGFAEMWEHTADARGHMQQSTGITCGPAAGVMLLHHHGVTASEGRSPTTPPLPSPARTFMPSPPILTQKLGRAPRTHRLRHASGTGRRLHRRRQATSAHPRVVYVEALTEEHAIVVDRSAGARGRERFRSVVGERRGGAHRVIFRKTPKARSSVLHPSPLGRGRNEVGRIGQKTTTFHKPLHPPSRERGWLLSLGQRLRSRRYRDS